MKAKLGILLPTYKRPHKLQAVADNLEKATHGTFTLYWGVEADDQASIDAAKATGHPVIINPYEPGYSNTTQAMYEQSVEPILFHANDDFEFPQDWNKPHLEFMKANPHIMVLGADDGFPHPSYSTISFFRREYIEKMSGCVDTPNRVFGPYHHNYVDTEFTLTAQRRGVWNKLEVPCIIHHHPGLTGADKDETYKKNDATAGADTDLFHQRAHLWESL